MKQDGYAIVDNAGVILESFARLPRRVVWPNGDATEPAVAGLAHGVWLFVERQLDDQGTESAAYKLGPPQVTLFYGKILITRRLVERPPQERAEKLSELKAEKLADLADRRWRAETGGISLPGLGDMPTDRETQNKLTAAYVLATADAKFSTRWKIAAGQFVSLDSATVIAVAGAVAAHVRTCFEREATASAQILAAGNDAELNAVDLAALFG